MDVFDLTIGVAAGVIMAGVCGWCIRCIAVAESEGRRPETRHLLALAVIAVLITLGFWSEAY